MGRWSGTHKGKDRKLRILATARLIKSGQEGSSLDYERALRCYDILIEALEDPETSKELSDITGATVEQVREISETIIDSLLFNRERDPFRSLGLPGNTDREALNKRWKRLLRLYHPDRFFNQKEYEEKAKKINEAFNEATARLSQKAPQETGKVSASRGHPFSERAGGAVRAEGDLRDIFRYSRYIPAFISILTFTVAVLVTIVFFINNFGTRGPANKERQGMVRGGGEGLPGGEEGLKPPAPGVPSSPADELLASLSNKSPSRSDREERNVEKRKNVQSSSSSPLPETPAPLPEADHPAAVDKPAPVEESRETTPPEQEITLTAAPPHPAQDAVPPVRTEPEAEREEPSMESSNTGLLTGAVHHEAVREEQPPVTTKESEAPVQQVSGKETEALIQSRDNDSLKMVDTKGASEPGSPLNPAATGGPEPSPAVETERPEALRQEDVNDFLKRYVSLYEKGDIDAFMGLFDRDAKENGQPISLMTGRYRDIFRKSKNRYQLKNISINLKGPDTADVKAVFHISRTNLEDGRNLQFRGRIKWTIKRISDSLKIVSLQYD